MHIGVFLYTRKTTCVTPCLVELIYQMSRQAWKEFSMSPQGKWMTFKTSNDSHSTELYIT